MKALKNTISKMAALDEDEFAIKGDPMEAKGRFTLDQPSLESTGDWNKIKQYNGKGFTVCYYPPDEIYQVIVDGTGEVFFDSDIDAPFHSGDSAKQHLMFHAENAIYRMNR